MKLTRSYKIMLIGCITAIMFFCISLVFAHIFSDIPSAESFALYAVKSIALTALITLADSLGTLYKSRREQ